MFKKTRKKFQASTQDSVDNISQLKNTVRHRFTNFLCGRSENQSIYTDNFGLVLEKWGISEKEIPQVCKDLKLRCFVLLLPFLIALVLFIQGKIVLASIIIIASSICISTSLWRLKILRRKVFLPYPAYLFGFFVEKFYKD